MTGILIATPAHSPARNDVWKTWLAAALWLTLIAIESTSWLSAQHTGSVLYSCLVWLFGQIDLHKFDIFHHYLRKTGHVVGYAMLSFLLFRAWRSTLPRIDLARWSLHWAGIAWIMTALVASLDEWHQSYLPSRTGNVRDVFLDSGAALMMQALLWVCLRQRTFRVAREQQ